MQRKVLGRGLEAIIPQDTELASRERVQHLKVSEIKPSRFQPRVYFSQGKLEELANSIKEKGVIQPVLVRSLVDGQYELIAGERRFKAVKFLGLEEIPAIVRRLSDADALETALIENIQREELNPVEEAQAYRRLSQEFGLTQEAIAQRVGKDKTSVSNLLRVLNLPEKVLDFLSQNSITLGHAKTILSLIDPKRQMTFCDQIVKKGLSVRQCELLVQHARRPRSAKMNLPKDATTQDLEERLQHLLGTKVRIHPGKKRGRIEIEYYSPEDLDRLLAILKV
ncbi:MAG: ParB/RepB/Spo0J family partition protein [Candidatus Omnitrophica bacterium]|nr:ParB/RepB/Spo0J family partition protein [Candidatus Omnitrophota bacterium]